jgi:hypothetical protein
MGACGYVLSCMALNSLSSQGYWLWSHFPGTGNPQAWLPGAQVCVELGLKDELDWADRW